VTPDVPRDDLTKAAAAAAQAERWFEAAQKSRAARQQAVNAADNRRSNASAARRTYDQDSIELDDRNHAAATALQKARDTVASFGAPSADTADLNSAWQSLTRWASAEHATLVARLPTLREAVSSAAKTADETRTEHARASRDLNQFREKQHTAATELDRLIQTRNLLVARQQDLRAKVSAQPDSEEVAGLIVELDNLEAAANAARDALSGARKAQARAQDAADAVSQLAQESRAKLGAVRDPLIRYGAPTITADALAAAWAQLDSWAKTRRQVLVTDMASATEAANRADVNYQQAIAALRDAIAQAELPLPDMGIPANDLRSAVIRDIATSVATARSAAEHITDRFHERERFVEQKEAATEQAQVATTLASLLRSDAFQAWLLESALSSLVADASDLLLEMSSGQFELRARNKDIEVIDHNDADSTRPVRTLSGGETFQASLALALALSRQVSALAASGAAKLESIFLDEGFGTLDETSLDVVAATLENLAATGERMVGVITHVSSLADRIPVRFQVTRTGAKSHIERINA
jgi:exonuclease SbcC